MQRLYYAFGIFYMYIWEMLYKGGIFNWNSTGRYFSYGLVGIQFCSLLLMVWFSEVLFYFNSSFTVTNANYNLSLHLSINYRQIHVSFFWSYKMIGDIRFSIKFLELVYSFFLYIYKLSHNTISIYILIIKIVIINAN